MKKLKVMKVFTRKREFPLVKEFLDSYNIPYELYTSADESILEPFELGVSYNYTKKIEPPLLYLARKGFINYHPAPLPGYPSGPQYELQSTERAIKEKNLKWGVTLHYMDEKYDSGPIIKKLMFNLHEPPLTRDEIGSITHWHLWQFFKETVFDVYHFGEAINEEYIEDYLKKN